MSLVSRKAKFAKKGKFVSLVSRKAKSAERQIVSGEDPQQDPQVRLKRSEKIYITNQKFQKNQIKKKKGRKTFIKRKKNVKKENTIRTSLRC